MKREQEGHVYRRGKGSNAWWILRYRQTINQNGQLITKQPAARLVPVGPHYRTKGSVAPLVKEKLAAINQWNTEPEKVVTIADFTEKVFLPYVQTNRRPSTAKGYRDVWEDHLRMRCADVLLRNVRTCTVQGWLDQVAAQDKTRDRKALRRETLKRIESALSGIFKYAKQQGYFDGQNPVTDSQVPAAPGGQVTHAYSLAEIGRMLAVVRSPVANAILCVAAYTALRRGEIEALCWEDLGAGKIQVAHSRWNGLTLDPKTEASAAPVPVIDTLASRLREYREYLGNPVSGPMFPGARKGKAVSLNNVLREIKPRLRQAGIAWAGWHAFRRGLATNLHDLGVPDKTIQAILRHSNVAVTQKCYIKTLAKQQVSAMNQLEQAMCAERALEVSAEDASGMVN